MNLSTLKKTAFIRRVLFPLILSTLLLGVEKAKAQEQALLSTDETVTDSAITDAPLEAERPKEQPAAGIAVPETPRSALPNEDYNIPFRFEVLGDGVKMSPMVFDYELIDENKLRVSDVTFSQGSFFMGIYQAGKASQLLNRLGAQYLGKEGGAEWIFVAKWPKAFLQFGNIEAISRSGKTLWKAVVSETDLDNWAKQLDGWKKALRRSGVSQADISKDSMLSTNFVQREFHLQKQPFWNLNEPFRFCVSNELEDGQYTRLCTQLLEVRHGKKKMITLSPFPELKKQARIIAFNEPAAAKGTKEVKVGETVQFFAELASGASYEFVTKPLKFNLVEILEPEGKPDMARIVAWGPRPSRDVEEIKNDRRGLLEKLIGRPWDQTIGDFRKFWQITIPRKNAMLNIPGTSGGLFRIDFEITKLPTEKIRPWANSKTVEGTYIDGVKIYGMSAPNTKVSSTMNVAEANAENPQEFTWEYGAKNPGYYNKSILLVDDQGKTYKTYREIYRGYGREISTRLTGLVGTGGNFIMMGELAFNYWFENLFGWNNPIVSRQRWGLSTKYFNSFNNVNLATSSNTISYLTADLKYRLDPGLWSRDEAWGLQVNSSQVTYDIFQAQMFGFGFFWARSMPKVFNDLFNNLPYMKYPKWVDMEFIYYPTTTTRGVTLFNIGQGYGNWQLNFHGKVMWGKQFFGEAGFGLKQLDFQQSVNLPGILRQRIQFTSFYGTVGLGWSF